ncbi:MAG: hypothetical protein HUJ86_02710, partial [Synergistes sp.]|nr:hypothetical protein [Synergistes sp.]
MKPKSWIIFVLSLTAAVLASIALLNFLLDPVFHYRKPPSFVKYLLIDQRYQNDGILKHFDYDTLITGTSMSEKFKTSEADKLFNAKSIKTPYAGASFKETNNAIEIAIKHNKNLKRVIRSLDLTKLDSDADQMMFSSYPEYLYDDNPFNNINYLLNLRITLILTIPSLLKTFFGQESTTFDDYSNLGKRPAFGKDVALRSYDRPEKSDKKIFLSEEDRKKTIENIEQNIENTIRNNPDIDFYYFITPYSILFWDSIARRGRIDRQLELQRILIERLVKYDNCHLFSWYDNEALITDLNNYSDAGHYSAKVNSDLLKWMKEGKGRLTKDNY